MKTGIIEGNKLIAEFMGGFKRTIVLQGIKQIPDVWDIVDSKSPLAGARVFDDDLKYLTSWDWLMPVVEKIEDIEDADGFKPFVVDINCAECDITQIKEAVEYISYNEAETKIKAVWLSVTEFIKWYNIGKDVKK